MRQVAPAGSLHLIELTIVCRANSRAAPYLAEVDLRRNSHATNQVRPARGVKGPAPLQCAAPLRSERLRVCSESFVRGATGTPLPTLARTSPRPASRA